VGEVEVEEVEVEEVEVEEVEVEEVEVEEVEVEEVDEVEDIRDDVDGTGGCGSATGRPSSRVATLCDLFLDFHPTLAA
jgi:hypothetical protein